MEIQSARQKLVHVYERGQINPKSAIHRKTLRDSKNRPIDQGNRLNLEIGCTRRFFAAVKAIKISQNQPCENHELLEGELSVLNTVAHM